MGKRDGSRCSGLAVALRSYELPNLGQMVIVMFGNKVKMVHQPHGRLQPRMQQSAVERGSLHCLHAIDQLQSCSAKFCQNLLHRARIVIGLMSFSIAEVGRGEFGPIGQEVSHTLQP